MNGVFVPYGPAALPVDASDLEGWLAIGRDVERARAMVRELEHDFAARLTAIEVGLSARTGLKRGVCRLAVGRAVAGPRAVAARADRERREMTREAILARLGHHGGEAMLRHYARATRIQADGGACLADAEPCADPAPCAPCGPYAP